MPRRLLLLCSIPLVLAAASGPAAAGPPSVEPLEEDDWYRHEGRAKQFTEFWTAILRSDDGWIVYVSLLRTNMGLVSGHAGVAVAVTAPDGTVTREKRRHDASDYREDRAAGLVEVDVQRLRFGKEGGAIGGRHAVHIDLERVDLDVELTPWTAGYEFGDGRRTVSEEHGWYMKYAFLVPRADVKGTLRVDGRTVPLEGDGYLEHMITNRSLTLWSRRWYVLNVFAPDLSVHFLEGHPLPGYERLHGRLGYFAVVDRSGVRLASAAPTLRFRKSEGPRESCTWPTEFVLTAADDGDRARVAWRSRGLHDPYVVLEQLSWPIRKLVGVILGNPVFFRFTNTYELRLSLDGEERRVKGTGLHQVVCLRPDP